MDLGGGRSGAQHWCRLQDLRLRTYLPNGQVARGERVLARAGVRQMFWLPGVVARGAAEHTKKLLASKRRQIRANLHAMEQVEESCDWSIVRDYEARRVVMHPFTAKSSAGRQTLMLFSFRPRENRLCQVCEQRRRLV